VNRTLAFSVVACLMLAPAASFAGDAHKDVIRILQSQGYTVESVHRSFLGRAKITVSNDSHTRQIVVSRSTGDDLACVAVV